MYKEHLITLISTSKSFTYKSIKKNWWAVIWRCGTKRLATRNAIETAARRKRLIFMRRRTFELSWRRQKMHNFLLLLHRVLSALFQLLMQIAWVSKHFSQTCKISYTNIIWRHLSRLIWRVLRSLNSNLFSSTNSINHFLSASKRTRVSGYI